MQFIPLALIMIPIVTALLIYLIKARTLNLLALAAQAVMTVLAVLYFIAYKDDFSQTAFVFGGWDARIGISLLNDALSMTFVFLTLLSWWLVQLYVFAWKKTQPTFLFFLMFLQGVFLGLLQTNDLFNMFVFLELTTLIVTILIAFKKAGDSFRAGLYYLLLNTSGVLAFLMGIIIIYYTFGTINIYAIRADMAAFADVRAVRFAYVLLIAGISVKSAFFPVFTWLPKAHGAAQSSISALLSGLIVKGGLYLFIRVHTMFEPAQLNIQLLYFYLGAAGAIVGAVFALSQDSIKQLLAYSTVSQIGVILMALSFDPTSFSTGAVFHLLNHAFAKMLLFFAAGIIIKVYKTKKLYEIQGLFKTMPFLAVVMIIAMLSLSGMPFLGGYASKSLIKYQLTEGTLMYGFFYASNVLTPIILLRLGKIFLGPKPLNHYFNHFFASVAMGLLALALIVFGIFFQPIFALLWSIDFSQVNPASLSSWLDYGFILGIAYLLYYFFLEKEKSIIDRIRHFSVSFETANILFLGYIVGLVTLYFIL